MTRPSFTRRPTHKPRFEELESRNLLSSNSVWTILGDQTVGQLDDTIVIQRSGQAPGILEAVVNGQVVSTHSLADLRQLRIFSGDGDDRVSVKLSNRESDFRVHIVGGHGNDHLIGTNGRDHIHGGAGDDSLDGAGGRDRIRGGAGNDSIHGGRGIDWIDAGGGTNTFYGNSDRDTLIRTGENPTFRQANTNPLHAANSVEELRNWVVQNSIRNWSWSFGRNIEATFGGPAGAPIFATDSGGSTTTTPPVSNTNTQEQGVDEADILKTDGKYLYTVVNGELLVIDASHPAQLQIVGRVAVSTGIDSFYLMGDRAVVLSHGYESTVSGNAGEIVAMRYAHWWGFYQPQTVVTTIDLTDRTAPTVVSETTLDGWLVDSRVVEGRVYVVVENSLAYAQPQLIATEDGYAYESEAEFRARLESNMFDVLPSYVTTIGDVTTVGSLVDGADLYLPETAEGDQLLSVAVFDPSATGPQAVTTIAGTSGTVYASTDSLYVAATDYYSPWRGEGESTQLYKFALNGDSVPLDAIGTVTGTVLDQFSMDEEAGLLRIATTSGWGTRATNSVFVLADTGEKLEVVGSVTGIAEGERIFSARFDGDVGYVVTFEQVDPLFTIDFSNPVRPELVGELVIPGFSSYLQLIGDGLLIGLGRDADPETGAVGGLQLSLFDVSDLANPQRLDLLLFSDEAWGGWSEAEWNHHAISWFADQGILTLPVSGDWSESAALQVLQVSSEGIVQLGAINHTSPVMRSLRIGDLLFSMSMGEIRVHDLMNPSIQIGGVELPTPPESDPIPIDGPIVLLPAGPFA